MNVIQILTNQIQYYEWGSRSAIPELLGTTNQEGKPQAELWMGAHPKASSELWFDGRSTSLSELIRKYPKAILGEKTAQKFQNRLPYLFKVLASEKPLSIQAHPDRNQAKKGFQKENALAVPLTAPHRNYKDPDHKPECLCALTDFWALKGFRSISDMVALMTPVCPDGLSDRINRLKKNPHPSELKHFFQGLMTMDLQDQKQLVENAMVRIENQTTDDACYQWMIRLNKEYPGDIGVFSPILLNLIHLEPGQALYIPSGELHAYLKGVGMELMANSDNVLRGGLTPKHVDVSELLINLTFQERPVHIILPRPIRSCEKMYPTPAEEFILSCIDIHDGDTYYGPAEHSAEILFCTKGKGEIHQADNNHRIGFSKGTSVLIPASAGSYEIHGGAVLYKASVPI